MLYGIISVGILSPLHVAIAQEIMGKRMLQHGKLVIEVRLSAGTEPTAWLDS